MAVNFITDGYEWRSTTGYSTDETLSCYIAIAGIRIGSYTKTVSRRRPPLACMFSAMPSGLAECNFIYIAFALFWSNLFVQL